MIQKTVKFQVRALDLQVQDVGGNGTGKKSRQASIIIP